MYSVIRNDKVYEFETIEARDDFISQIKQFSHSSENDRLWKAILDIQNRLNKLEGKR